MTTALTKAAIRESALKELRWRGYTVWIQNNLAVRGRKFIGRKGVSDIMGFTYHGQVVAVEVKTVNDVLSDDQIQFLNEVKKAGGVALIAKDVNGHVALEDWEIKRLKN